MRFENVLVEVLLGLVEKTPLHGVEQLGDLCGQLGKRNGDFFAVIASYCHAYAVFNIARTDLDTEGNTLHLVLCALPAKAVVAEVDLRTDACRLERIVKLGGLFGDAFLMLSNGNDYDLYGSDARRKNETVVVAVGHDYAADYAR